MWEDDHVSRYSFVGLRQACPCAECRGGHEGMSVPPDPEVLRQPLAEGRSAELVALEAVGNYAILPTWADGHRFGIYTWEVLRRLCPCGAHTAETPS